MHEAEDAYSFTLSKKQAIVPYGLIRSTPICVSICIIKDHAVRCSYWNKKTSKVVQFQVQIKVLDGYTKYLVRTSFSHVMQQGVSISEIGT